MFKQLKNNIFNDLATLTEAGISILDAARRVAASHPKMTQWSGVIVSLEKGNQLNIALGKNKLISRYEQEVIAVAEYAGRVSEGLRNIANSYDKRNARISRLKSKLYFPFAVLLIAIIISAILQIARTPDISVISVITSSLLWLVIAIIITKFILNLMQRDACQWLSMTNQYQTSEWYKIQFQQVVFGALLWHNSSGIDFKSGFSRVSKILDSKTIRKKLLMASHFCGQGLSVSESIKESQLPITKEFYQILLVAEQSGRWEYSVNKYLEKNAANLDLRIDNAFEWTPRIYYSLIVLMVISVIL